MRSEKKAKGRGREKTAYPEWNKDSIVGLE